MPSSSKGPTRAASTSTSPQTPEAPKAQQSRVPRYRRLKRANGRHLAFVEIGGRRTYLGAWNSAESKQAYRRLLVERNRGMCTHLADEGGVFVDELIAAFLDHARTYYRTPDGEPTREIANITPMLRILRDLYGGHLASQFDARALKSVRQAMIEKGYARTTINRLVVRLRSMFKWGVSEGLVDPQVHVSLSTVGGLRAGRTVAKETSSVMPVTDAQIEATMPFPPPVLQDMVRVQLCTGMRPGELCQMRSVDIEAAGELWVYRPRSHKTQHRGRERLIAIGPRAQAILQTYRLSRPLKSAIFSPVDAQRQRAERKHAERKTPLNCGSASGTNRRQAPRPRAGLAAPDPLDDPPSPPRRRPARRIAKVEPPAREPIRGGKATRPSQTLLRAVKRRNESPARHPCDRPRGERNSGTATQLFLVSPPRR